MKLLSLTIVFLIWSCSFFSQNMQRDGMECINSENLIETVTYLSSKKLAGRLPGTEGYNIAACYMAEQFNSIGLKPIGDSAYFQFFQIETNQIKSPCYIAKGNKIYKLGEDFVCRGFTGSGQFKKEVVFCGYGQKLKGYNDYENIDVKDKIVMIFKKNPDWKVDSTGWKIENIRDKVNLAYENGAVGVLFVSKPNDKKPQPIIGSVMEGEGKQRENFPQVHIDIDVADSFLEKSGYSLKYLQTKIDSVKKPYSLKTEEICEMNINAFYTEKARTMNIIGMIEGSDEKLKNEYVLISAHLDHVGEQGGEIYFPGANDNASGSAAVMEIARSFIKNNIKPKRSILFILFACEEHGLDGSEYCVNHLPASIDKIISLMNMDCIAYGDSIMLGSGKSSPNLWNMAKDLDKKYINLAVNNTWAGGGADATPFHKKGIPTLYFVTTNSYDHLHLPSDTPETLNLPLYEKITRLAFLCLYEVSMGNYQREELMK
ncbi:MAG: M20/M25/M40 family metallo-hydrolase [Bacteroidota bacterium]